VSAEEQTRRLQDRIDDPRKVWKLSPMDVASYTRWNDYTKARDAMFSASNTAWAPWVVVPSDDKRRARLGVIRHLLDSVPYTRTKLPKVELPKRKIDRRYQRPRHFPDELVSD
jgi:polyphosphate kinase 2 (PPK2 family)